MCIHRYESPPRTQMAHSVENKQKLEEAQVLGKIEDFSHTSRELVNFVFFAAGSWVIISSTVAVRVDMFFPSVAW